MGLFVCDKCHCVENTTLGRYWTKDFENLWDKDNLGQALCSECAPTTVKNGKPSNHDGKWHGEFPKRKATDKELQEEGYFIYVPKDLRKINDNDTN